jgi:hypothetical protein
MRTLLLLFALLIAWPVYPQGSLSPSPWLTFTDSSGRPLAGGKLCTYAAGTTNPLSTYSEYTLNVANTNPITLDSAGQAVVYLAPLSYKFVLHAASSSTVCPASGVVIKTQDNITNDYNRILSNVEIDHLTIGNTGTSTLAFRWAATASVADGGTITHGAGDRPTAVLCTTSTAQEMCSITAMGTTTFTVAIKKYDGSAGTTQTIYWLALK